MREFLLEEFDEVERYELSEGLPYRFRPNRRQVVQMLGAGLVISVTARVAVGQQRRGGDAARAEKVSERFHIATDGTVTVMTSKVEVGQGSRTQLTQAAAEELHVPMSQIQLIMADTQLCPDDGGTAGSRTTPSTVPRVRNAAAVARELLIDLAAKMLMVERSQVALQDGQFVIRDSAQRLSLGELASDSKFASVLSSEPKQDTNGNVASVDEWRVLGKTAAKVNGDAAVTGKAQYPSDITRPGMLYGKVLGRRRWVRR
jgi:isoquinoline 1-oxidoreductase